MLDLGHLGHSGDVLKVSGAKALSLITSTAHLQLFQKSFVVTFLIV